MYVDVPLEIGLPHFVHDDTMADSGAALGNFKLVLQSLVCHRGQSLDSGHYVSLVRGVAPDDAKRNRMPGSPAEDSWILFDDLSQERVRHVDVRQTLKDETPYLLFYQVIPIEEGGGIDDGRSPPQYMAGEYAESTPSYTSGSQSAEATIAAGPARSNSEAQSILAGGSMNSTSSTQGRPSVSFEELPLPNKTNGGLDVPAAAAVPIPRSRNSSKTRGENRLSTSLSRLAAATTAFSDGGEKARLRKEKQRAKGKPERECAVM